MTLKDQWNIIKDNWLIAVVLIVVLLLFISPIFSGSGGGYAKSALMADSGYAQEMASVSYRGGGDFAPEVEERKVTKTTSLSSEIERGEFKSAETKLKAIVITTDSYLLNENSQKYGVDRNAYLYGSYTIKVDVNKYDAVIEQLKDLGEVQSFSENAQDITGRHTSLTQDLAAEKSRLQKFQAMYNSATEIEDKIQLTDKIYDLERRISSYEDALENIDNRVEYSTVYVTLTEERSGYANVMFVKFSELVRGFVDSVSGLFTLIFWVIPWALAALVLWWIVRIVRKRV